MHAKLARFHKPRAFTAQNTLDMLATSLLCLRIKTLKSLYVVLSEQQYRCPDVLFCNAFRTWYEVSDNIAVHMCCV